MESESKTTNETAQDTEGETSKLNAQPSENTVEPEKDSWEKRYYSEAAIKERGAEEERRKRTKQENRRLMSFVLIFMTAFFVLYFISINNPNIYAINNETLSVINEALNALVLLLIPFFLGSLGAIARVLLAEISVQSSLTLIVSSGMMGMFSWVGIKSEILVSLLTPYIQTSSTQAQEVASKVADPAIHNFYSMALVAILVGMFSSNVYIFINQKVERLTSESSRNDVS